MKLLILTQYFPPEVGAPQNRLYELARALVKIGVEVEILTAMPNYPQMKVLPDYHGKIFLEENAGGLKIYRSYIFSKNSKNIMLRLLNYFSFVFSSLLVSFKIQSKYDYILCESPPLFLGISAIILKYVKKAKLIFNVSDLWPESAEKLGLVTNQHILKMTTKLEEFLYKKSDFITGQTRGIVENISERFPQKKIHWLPNGMTFDENSSNLYEEKLRKEYGFQPNDFLLCYAGILGHAQGLEVIMYAAEKLKVYNNIHFMFFGDGPVKEVLLSLKDDLNLQNIHFYGVVEKEKIRRITKEIDAAIIPLKKIDLFLGAIPSKIFENLAARKPILLGVNGEAKNLFIDEGNCGIHFEPENHNELADAILKLYNDSELKDSLGNNGRNYIFKNFNRIKIADNFYKFLTNN